MEQGSTRDTEQSLVLTAVGADRAGLVNAITRGLHQAGANVEDARMAILGGEFALLMLVTGNAAVMQRVDESAKGLEAQLGLSIITRRTQRAATGRHLLYHLRVSGFDHPGIVHSVSSLLADLNINVARLDTRLSYAPLSGTPMFILNAELQIPSQSVLRELRKGLERVAEAEDLDTLLEAPS